MLTTGETKNYQLEIDIKKMERNLLNKGRILSLSVYTARSLNRIAGEKFKTTILSMPVDSNVFKPCPNAVVPLRIGFTGRIDDPRKNIELLLDAMVYLKNNGQEVTALLIGGKPTAETLQKTDKLGLNGQVKFVLHVSRAEICQQLQTMDVFVLPSYQEGLCISALEAMSCGIPVVSTRCGGPEEFVIPGKTGILVDFNAREMARAIQAIINDRNLRKQLSIGARQIIEERYTIVRAESVFWNIFDSTYPNLQKREHYSCIRY